MIQSKEDYLFYVQEDTIRNEMNIGWRAFLSEWLVNSEKYCVWRYLRLLRKCEYYRNCKSGRWNKVVYMFHRICLERLGNKYHIYIPLNVAGYGLRIMHLSGGGGCRLRAVSIGNYCGVNSGVLCGQKNEQFPVIGDYVTLGPGAKVIGGVTIGSHSFVAPNAVVVHDVPANSVVGGVPARILSQKVGGIYS